MNLSLGWWMTPVPGIVSFQMHPIASAGPIPDKVAPLMPCAKKATAVTGIIFVPDRIYSVSHAKAAFPFAMKRSLQNGVQSFCFFVNQKSQQIGKTVII